MTIISKAAKSLAVKAHPECFSKCQIRWLMQVPGSQGQVLGTIDRQLWILIAKNPFVKGCVEKGGKVCS